MKTGLIQLVVVVVVMLFVSASYRPEAKGKVDGDKLPPCRGYTILEFGKGINCNGDTIRLEKVFGGQVATPLYDTAWQETEKALL